MSDNKPSGVVGYTGAIGSRLSESDFVIEPWKSNENASQSMIHGAGTINSSPALRGEFVFDTPASLEKARNEKEPKE